MKITRNFEALVTALTLKGIILESITHLFTMGIVSSKVGFVLFVVFHVL